MSFTQHSLPADLIVTTVIAAPFGVFVMGVMAVQRKLKERLRHLSETDQLTGLYNRQAFLTRAAEKLSKHPDATILMIDVDHFKAVNDKYGHFIGDACLRRVGQHLSNCMRTGDVVGRIGGEEFAAILLDTDVRAADLVSSNVCRPIEVDGFKDIDIEMVCTRVTMSVGGIMALPGQDLTELMRYADQALYRAKSDGRARVVFYEANVNGTSLAS